LKSVYSRGEKIVMERLIKPYYERQARYVGVELEYPVIPLGGGYDLRKAASDLFAYMIGRHGCSSKTIGTDGEVTGIKSAYGDTLSFELHYGSFEFAMWRSENFSDVAARFYHLFKLVSEYLTAHGYIMSGMGTNLKADMDNLLFTTDYIARYAGEYMREHTSYKRDNCLLMNMFSTQTHIEIDGERLIDSFNLFNRIDFVRGLLFSNSLPHEPTLPAGKRYPEGTLCARDFNWKYSDFPNAGCFDGQIKNTDELAEYIAEMEFFLDIENGELVPVDKISVNRYFENSDKPDDKFTVFRMMSNLALNNYHTLEIRDDCVQPVSEAFAPCVFHLGILSDINAASEVTEAFFRNHGIDAPNSVLREMAVTGKKIVDDKDMKSFLRCLFDISKAALVKRGFGEESYMECLRWRIENLSSPAKLMVDEFAKGVTLDEMILRYGAGGHE
jgi:gamma-glutamylcysteine synthetase